MRKEDLTGPQAQDQKEAPTERVEISNNGTQVRVYRNCAVTEEPNSTIIDVGDGAKISPSVASLMSLFAPSGASAAAPQTQNSSASAAPALPPRK